MPAAIKDVRAHLRASVDVDEQGCWLWRLRKWNGYGKFRQGLAHREAYAAFVAPIPAGYQVDHLCRVRHCINPAHLEAVTQAENIRRSAAPTIVNWRANTCARGHSMEDAYPVRRGGRIVGRVCRTCTKVKNARNYQRRRYLDGEGS